MKFLGIIILELVRGSLYTDENLYHEDKADGKHGVSLDKDINRDSDFFRYNLYLIND